MGGAQAIMTFMNMGTLATFTLALGPLFRLFDGKAVLAMAVTSAAGLLLGYLALRQPQSAGSGGRTSEPS